MMFYKTKECIEMFILIMNMRRRKRINKLEFVFYMKTDCIPAPYWSDVALYSILQRDIYSENK